MQREVNWTPDRKLFREVVEKSPLLAWLTDPDGYCIYLSPSWYRFTGFSEADGEGYGWLNAIDPADRAETARAFFDANATKTSYQVTYHLITTQGNYSPVWAHGTPRFDSSGAFQGLMGVVTTFSTYAKTVSMTRAQHAPSHQILTAREREVLTLIATGRTSYNIAGVLGISEKTVNVHCQNAVSKLGATNRIGAIIKAAKLNEIQIDSDQESNSPANPSLP